MSGISSFSLTFLKRHFATKNICISARQVMATGNVCDVCDDPRFTPECSHAGVWVCGASVRACDRVKLYSVQEPLRKTNRAAAPDECLFEMKTPGRCLGFDNEPRGDQEPGTRSGPRTVLRS